MNARTRAASPGVPRATERATRTVAIGIPTFRRRNELARLLESLPAVAEDVVDQHLAASVDLIVVDNAPEQDARDVVAAFGRAGSGRVRYVAEARRGLASVRNRILDESDGYDLVAFIDDDETPADPSWLSRLLRARDRFGADAVAGPVTTVSETPLDPWIVVGGFFARSHRSGLPTGASIERAATNNLLLDRRLIGALGIRFDERFARTGGEDSLFTEQLHRSGAHLVWAADAGVLDHLPMDRRSRSHAVRRARAMAAAGVNVALALSHSSMGRVRVRVRAVAAGSLRVALGVTGGLIGWALESRTLRARGVRRVARGLGALDAVRGRREFCYGAQENE